MAPRKTATETKSRSAKPAGTSGKASPGFSVEEKAAKRERIRELKAEAARADGETELLAAIAKMHEPDRAMAQKVHALIRAAAPGLAPKTINVPGVRVSAGPSAHRGSNRADLDERAGHPQPSDTRSGHQGRFIGSKLRSRCPIPRREVDAVDDEQRPVHNVSKVRAGSGANRPALR